MKNELASRAKDVPRFPHREGRYYRTVQPCVSRYGQLPPCLQSNHRLGCPSIEIVSDNDENDDEDKDENTDCNTDDDRDADAADHDDDAKDAAKCEKAGGGQFAAKRVRDGSDVSSVGAGAIVAASIPRFPASRQTDESGQGTQCSALQTALLRSNSPFERPRKAVWWWWCEESGGEATSWRPFSPEFVQGLDLAVSSSQRAFSTSSSTSTGSSSVSMLDSKTGTCYQMNLDSMTQTDPMTKRVRRICSSTWNYGTTDGILQPVTDPSVCRAADVCAQVYWSACGGDDEVFADAVDAGMAIFEAFLEFGGIEARITRVPNPTSTCRLYLMHYGAPHDLSHK